MRQKRFYRAKSRKIKQRGGNLEVIKDEIMRDPYFSSYTPADSFLKPFPNLQSIRGDAETGNKINDEPIPNIIGHLQLWFPACTNAQQFTMMMSEKMRTTEFKEFTLQYLINLESTLRGQPITELSEQNYPLRLFALLGSSVESELRPTLIPPSVPTTQ
jgi:hypothetical protein